MKTLKYIIILISYFSLSASSCKKDKTGIDALPAATQEGRNTFGCLVNGEVFSLKRQGLGPLFQCYYTNYQQEGYYFKLSAYSDNKGYDKTIVLSSDSLKLEENKIYNLGLPNILGDTAAEYIYTTPNFYIVKDKRGQLKITKLDEIKRIISGTFWFDAVNEAGEKVEVREGRFDMKY
ncbi:DUF6252 family protein [Pedobacter glucosidilyticus]|uniref:DUF6252 family protein n=1 Tax=Pedobacter glucosidilyticus TaxID=1122941 RepID=UPI0026EE819E|nr:DUF6252 family protein [Pedobacter glucosidilyticus]